MSKWWDDLTNKNKMIAGFVFVILVFVLGIFFSNTFLSNKDTNVSHFSGPDSRSAETSKSRQEEIHDKHQKINEEAKQVKSNGIALKGGFKYYKTDWTKQQLQTFIDKVNNGNDIVLSDLGTKITFAVSPAGGAGNSNTFKYDEYTKLSAGLTTKNKMETPIFDVFYESPEEYILSTTQLKNNRNHIVFK